MLNNDITIMGLRKLPTLDKILADWKLEMQP